MFHNKEEVICRRMREGAYKLNIIEIHLILNHIPIIGVAVVSAYLLIAIIFKNTFMQKVSLWFLLCLAVVTIGVYLSGLGAETPVKSLPGVSNFYLQLHEKVARIAAMTIWAIGGITFLGLLFLRNRELLFKYFVRGVFAMTLLSNALFILTGYLGGQITHAEIRSTLGEGISTRAISLGVIAIMAVILIAMIVPLFLHRNQIFKKVGPNTMGQQGHIQQGGQIPADEPGRTGAFVPSWCQSLQQGNAGGSVSRNVSVAPTQQLLEQPSAHLSLLKNAKSWSSIQGPSGQFQQTAPAPGANNTPSQPNSRFQSPSAPSSLDNGVNSQFAFSASQRQRNGSSGFDNSSTRGQEYRSFSEEITRPLPVVSSQPQPFPIAALNSKQLKGGRGLLLAGGLPGVIILLGALGFAVFMKFFPPSLPLQVIADIPLTGSPNRFDYQNLDLTNHLLYITHSGSNMMTIFDTATNKIVADVPGISDAHDVAIVPDPGRLYVTSAKGNLVAVVDEHTHAIIARIPVGAAPDGLTYDPTDHKIFVVDEAGQNYAVINPRTEQRIAEIPAGGDAGDIEYDAPSHHLLAVVESLNQLIVIDPVSYKILARYALSGCQGANDLLIDEQQRLAFVDCGDNNAIVMVDLSSMKVIASDSVGKNPDLMALDTNLHYLYVGSESGEVAVFDEHDRTLQKLSQGYVASAAHSVVVDPVTHYVYLPLQNVGGKPILRIALFHHP